MFTFQGPVVSGYAPPDAENGFRLHQDSGNQGYGQGYPRACPYQQPSAPPADPTEACHLTDTSSSIPHG